ncbi:hypothetical protein ACU8KH_01798 [Lachancea thermotolerans]
MYITVYVRAHETRFIEPHHRRILGSVTNPCVLPDTETKERQAWAARTTIKERVFIGALKVDLGQLQATPRTALCRHKYVYRTI